MECAAGTAPAVRRVWTCGGGAAARSVLCAAATSLGDEGSAERNQIRGTARGLVNLNVCGARQCAGCPPRVVDGPCVGCRGSAGVAARAAAMIGSTMCDVIDE